MNPSPSNRPALKDCIDAYVFVLALDYVRVLRNHCRFHFEWLLGKNFGRPDTHSTGDYHPTGEPDRVRRPDGDFHRSRDGYPSFELPVAEKWRVRQRCHVFLLHDSGCHHRGQRRAISRCPQQHGRKRDQRRCHADSKFSAAKPAASHHHELA